MRLIINRKKLLPDLFPYHRFYYEINFPYLLWGFGCWCRFGEVGICIHPNSTCVFGCRCISYNCGYACSPETDELNDDFFLNPNILSDSLLIKDQALKSGSPRTQSFFQLPNLVILILSSKDCCKDEMWSRMWGNEHNAWHAGIAKLNMILVVIYWLFKIFYFKDIMYFVISSQLYIILGLQSWLLIIMWSFHKFKLLCVKISGGSCTKAYEWTEQEFIV